MFAQLFLFLFKILYFFLYPLSCLVRALEMSPSHAASPVHTHESLFICASNYLLLQLLSHIFNDDIVFWALLVLIVGTHFLRRRGYIEKGLNRVVEYAERKKKVA